MTDLIRRKRTGEAWETEVDTGGGGTGLPPQWTVDDATGKVTGESTGDEATLTINASPDGDKDALRVNYDNSSIALQIGEDTGFQARGRNGLDNVDNNGGDIAVHGGDGAEDGSGGDADLLAGGGGSGGGQAGTANVTGGSGPVGGGDANLQAGNGGSQGGGDVSVHSGGSIDGAGGSVSVTAGDSDNSDGGSVILQGGAGAGEGGEIRLTPGGGLGARGMISIRDAGGNEMIRVRQLGQLGFYGAAGVDQPVVPLTAPSVQDVIDALVALGLVSQSD